MRPDYSVHDGNRWLRGPGQVKAFYMDNTTRGFSGSNRFLKGSEKNPSTGGLRAGDYSAITLDEDGSVFAVSMEGQLPAYANAFISSYSNWG